MTAELTFCRKLLYNKNVFLYFLLNKFMMYPYKVSHKQNTRPVISKQDNDSCYRAAFVDILVNLSLLIWNYFIKASLYFMHKDSENLNDK